MPRYDYKCAACGIELTVVHSMSEQLSDCESCGTVDGLHKVPSIAMKLKKKDERKVGSIVNDYIKDAKKELNQEKKNLKRQEK